MYNIKYITLVNLNNRALKKLEAIKNINSEVYNKILKIEFKHREFSFNINPTLQLHEIDVNQMLELDKKDGSLSELKLAMYDLLEEIKFFRVDEFNNIFFVNIQHITV